MKSDNVHVVTGAYGFSGKYIAKRLLDSGYQVRTLTNSMSRENPFGDAVKAYPLDFDCPEKMIEALRGASVLYNNYWVRFNYSDHIAFSYDKAVNNSLKLFQAAKEAGIRRIVHISITNPAEDSPFEYFRGKAKLERAIRASGLSYAILRPAVLFGKEDILINNIAWFVRKFPIFGYFGNGNYRLQPIFVGDLAQLALEQGQLTDNSIINAIGPETFTYRDLIAAIVKVIGEKRLIIPIPSTLGYIFGFCVGKILGDITITHDEIKGLMADLLYTNSPPVGKTSLTDWLIAHSGLVGMHYSSELQRRINRTAAYEKL